MVRIVARVACWTGVLPVVERPKFGESGRLALGLVTDYAGSGRLALAAMGLAPDYAGGTN